MSEDNRIELVTDSHHGIYCPQFTLQSLTDKWTGISDEDRETVLAGPDAEWYWESWDNTLNSAKFTDADGHGWSLYQDQDVWAIRNDVPYHEYPGDCWMSWDEDEEGED